MSNKIFVGLALSSTMFQGDCTITRKQLSIQEAKELLKNNVISCCNPSHESTLTALKERFNICVPVPEVAPKVHLEPGDSLIVLSARFSRRLAEGEKFTESEVQNAVFEFVQYSVN